MSPKVTPKVVSNDSLEKELKRAQKWALSNINTPNKQDDFKYYKCPSSFFETMIKLGFITCDSQPGLVDTLSQKQRAYIAGYMLKERAYLVCYWINMYTDFVAFITVETPREYKDPGIVVTHSKCKNIKSITGINSPIVNTHDLSLKLTLTSSDSRFYERDTRVTKNFVEINIFDPKYGRVAFKKGGLWLAVIKCLKLSPKQLKEEAGTYGGDLN
jgi:hypothetical protein